MVFFFFFFGRCVSSWQFNDVLLLVLPLFFCILPFLFFPFFFSFLLGTKSWTMVPENLFCGRSLTRYLVNLLLHKP